MADLPQDMTSIQETLKWAPVIVTSVGILFTAIFAIVRMWLNHRLKMDEFLIQSLPMFGGGTQRRNIGIAVVEGYVSQTKNKPRRFRKIIVPLLINQAIYLLFTKPEKQINENRNGPIFEKHEIKNVHKIIELLKQLRKERSFLRRIFSLDHNSRIFSSDRTKDDYQVILKRYKHLNNKGELADISDMGLACQKSQNKIV